MKLMEKIKEEVKNNDRLYVIARGIRNCNDPDLVKLIRGYYERPQDYTSILVVHNGMKYPDDMIYHIEIYKTVEEKNAVRSMGKGFAAALYWTLKELIFADIIGLIPVVEWENM